MGCRESESETVAHFVGVTFGGSTLEMKKLPIAIANSPARTTFVPVFLMRITLPGNSREY